MSFFLIFFKPTVNKSWKSFSTPENSKRKFFTLATLQPSQEWAEINKKSPKDHFSSKILVEVPLESYFNWLEDTNIYGDQASVRALHGC